MKVLFDTGDKDCKALYEKTYRMASGEGLFDDRVKSQKAKTLGDMLDILTAIRDGVKLPENPTNGDVIKALFPDSRIEQQGDCVGIIYEKSKRHTVYDVSFSIEWWNAPYEKEVISQC